MLENIYFLKVSGVFLPLPARVNLFREAIAMARKFRSSGRVKGDEFEGRITTRFTSVSFCGVGGMLFSATIETDGGTGKAKFLVSSSAIDNWISEEGLWTEEPAPPGLDRAFAAAEAAQFN